MRAPANVDSIVSARAGTGLRPRWFSGSKRERQLSAGPVPSSQLPAHPQEGDHGCGRLHSDCPVKRLSDPRCGKTPLAACFWHCRSLTARPYPYAASAGAQFKLQHFQPPQPYASPTPSAINEESDTYAKTSIIALFNPSGKAPRAETHRLLPRIGATCPAPAR
jgi:hypothetical protein